jgi:hypothetical protein
MMDEWLLLREEIEKCANTNYFLFLSLPIAGRGYEVI